MRHHAFRAWIGPFLISFPELVLLEIRDLIRIETIVANGSFSAAARALGITQPVLTRDIASLEKDLRGPLFRRSRSGAVPTALCRMILADAPDILARMQALQDRLGSMRGGSGRELSIVAGPFHFETLCLPAAIAFQRAQPRVRLKLETLPWPDAISRLRTHLTDIAVTTTHASETDEFVAHSFAPQPLVFAVRGGHPLARRSNIAASSVLLSPLVTTSHLIPSLQRALAELRILPATKRRADLPFPAILMETMSGWERVLRESDFVALITPAPFEEAIRKGEIVPLQVQAPRMAARHAAFQIRKRAASPLAQRFLNELRLANERALRKTLALCPWLRQ